MSFFERDQENLIDYVKSTAADSVFRAVNFTTATTRGMEAVFRWISGINVEQISMDECSLHSVMVSYTFLDSHIDAVNVYKSVYSFTHPKHQLSAECSGALPLSVKWTASAVHKIKIDGSAYTLVDAKVSRLLSHINVFLQGTNLLNQSYEEIADVPLPGRWLWAGVELKIF